MFDDATQQFNVAVTATDESFQAVQRRTNSSLERMEQVATRVNSRIVQGTSAATDRIAEYAAKAQIAGDATLTWGKAVEQWTKRIFDAGMALKTINLGIAGHTLVIQGHTLALEAGAAALMKFAAIRAATSAGINYVSPFVSTASGAYLVGKGMQAVGNWVYGQGQQNEQTALTAARTGQGFWTVQASDLISKRTGIAPSDLLAMAGKASAAAKVNEISTQSWSGSRRSDIEVLGDTMAKIGAIADPMERAAAAFKTFGDLTDKAWPQLNDNVNRGVKSIETFGAVLTRTSRDNIAEFTNDMRALGHEMDVFTSGAWITELKQGIKFKVQGAIAGQYVGMKDEFSRDIQAALAPTSQVPALVQAAGSKGAMTQASTWLAGNWEYLTSLVPGMPNLGVLPAQGTMGKNDIRSTLDFESRMVPDILRYGSNSISPAFLAGKALGINSDPWGFMPGPNESPSAMSALGMDMRARMKGGLMPGADQALSRRMFGSPSGGMGPQTPGDMMSAQAQAIIDASQAAIAKWRQSRAGLAQAHSEAMSSKMAAQKLLTEGGWVYTHELFDEKGGVRKDSKGNVLIGQDFHKLTPLEQFQAGQQLTTWGGIEADTQKQMLGRQVSAAIRSRQLSSGFSSEAALRSAQAGGSPIASLIADMRNKIEGETRHISTDEEGNAIVNRFKLAPEVLSRIVEVFKLQVKEITKKIQDEVLEMRSQFAGYLAGSARDVTLRAIQFDSASFTTDNPYLKGAFGLSQQGKSTAAEVSYQRTDQAIREADIARKYRDEREKADKALAMASPSERGVIGANIQALIDKYDQQMLESGVKAGDAIKKATDAYALAIQESISRIREETMRQRSETERSAFEFSGYPIGMEHSKALRGIELENAGIMDTNPKSAALRRLAIERRRLGLDVSYTRSQGAFSELSAEYPLNETKANLLQSYGAQPNEEARAAVLDRVKSIDEKIAEMRRQSAIKVEDDISKIKDESAIRSAEITKSAYEKQFNSIKESAGHLFDVAITKSKDFGDALKQVLLSAFLTPIREGVSNTVAKFFMGGAPGAGGAGGGGGGYGGGFGGGGGGFDRELAPAMSLGPLGPGGSGMGFGDLSGMGLGNGFGIFGQGGFSGGSQGGGGGSQGGGGGGTSLGYMGSMNSMGGIGSMYGGMKKLFSKQGLENLKGMFYNSESIQLGDGRATTAEGIGGLKGTLAGIMTSKGAASLELAAGVPLAMAGITGRRRGTWAGIAEATGGGALVGAGIGTMIAPGIGTLIGAGVGAAAGLGIGVAEKVLGIESKPNQARRMVQEIYHISIDNSMADKIVGIAQSKYAGHISMAVRDKEVRDLVELYAAASGQKMAMSATTPYGASLSEQGGKLYQDPTYRYGNAYTYSSSLPTAGGAASRSLPYGGGAGLLQLNISGQGAAQFIAGQVVTPQYVQTQWSNSASASNGRVSNAAVMSQPGLTIR